jgi:hypothetical protein
MHRSLPRELKGVDGRIILKESSKSGMVRHGLDRSGSDRDTWRAVVNAVMNFCFP